MKDPAGTEEPRGPGGRPRLRKRILDLHLYAGLLLSPYLILYGVSSLQFSHPFTFLETPRATVEWERSLDLAGDGTDAELAESVREELGLFGNVRPWTLTRNGQDHLVFQIARPGKAYSVVADLEGGQTQVVERRARIWGINHLLHGGGRIPGSKLMTLWWLFTHLSVVVVVFAAISGVYLWFVSKRDRNVGWSVVVAAFVSFFGFLAYLVS